MADQWGRCFELQRPSVTRCSRPGSRPGTRFCRGLGHSGRGWQGSEGCLRGGAPGLGSRLPTSRSAPRAARATLPGGRHLLPATPCPGYRPPDTCFPTSPAALVCAPVAAPQPQSTRGPSSGLKAWRAERMALLLVGQDAMDCSGSQVSKCPSREPGGKWLRLWTRVSVPAAHLWRTASQQWVQLRPVKPD